MKHIKLFNGVEILHSRIYENNEYDNTDDILGKVIIDEDKITIMYETITYYHNSVYFKTNGSLFNTIYITNYNNYKLLHPSILLKYPEILEYIIISKNSNFNKHFKKIYNIWMKDDEMRETLDLYTDSRELGLL